MFAPADRPSRIGSAGSARHLLRSRPSMAGADLGGCMAFVTLARRRFALSAHTPREIVVPLLTPILFADVIAPALAVSLVPRGRTEFMSLSPSARLASSCP